VNKQTLIEIMLIQFLSTALPTKSPSLSIRPTRRDPREVLPIESLKEEGDYSHERNLHETRKSPWFWISWSDFDALSGAGSRHRSPFLFLSQSPHRRGGLIVN